MIRQVVKELPANAVPVRPSEQKPFWTETRVMWVDKDGREIDSIQKGATLKPVELKHGWCMNSTLARLIGEAKSLNGRYLRITGEPQLEVNCNFIAWFTDDNGMKLYTDGTAYYM
jgi:hypothetical protein